MFTQFFCEEAGFEARIDVWGARMLDRASYSRFRCVESIFVEMIGIILKRTSDTFQPHAWKINSFPKRMTQLLRLSDLAQSRAQSTQRLQDLINSRSRQQRLAKSSQKVQLLEEQKRWRENEKQRIQQKVREAKLKRQL